jgi:hypothetical protein
VNSVMAEQSATVEFYGPHPGFAGAAKPIPESVRLGAESLDGTIGSVSDAIEYLSSLIDPPMALSDCPRYGFIGLAEGVGFMGGSHWRVICYRPVGADPDEHEAGVAALIQKDLDTWAVPVPHSPAVPRKNEGPSEYQGEPR